MKTATAAAALFLLSLLFWLLPELDLWVTRLFYNPIHHQFWFREHPQFELLRQGIIMLLIGLNVALVLVLSLKTIKPGWVKRFKAKTAIYLIVCFLIAPGLVVNLILKDHWGRPRPHQVQNYGGVALFQPVWQISQQCERNCSFVCGDCAMVFTLFALMPLLRHKKLTFVMVSLLGLLVSFMRVSAGGHFLSDALLSGLIVYLVVGGIYRIFYHKNWFEEGRIEKAFAHLHIKLVRCLP